MEAGVRGVRPPPSGRPSSWDEVFRATVATALDGERVEAGGSLSVGSGQTTREILNHSFELGDVRHRLLGNPRVRFNLLAAVGRFAWMMSGSDRLEVVEYYDANARRFSDDGLTVPGSSDGARLLNPRPGLNQLARVVELLTAEPGTRRAVATVYQAEDAGRRSRDVPCHLAVAYNLRPDGLHATTLMRSSNVVRVLPYDVFLFTLLAEFVAAAAGTEVAGYHQFTVSLHVYERDVPLAEEILAAAPTGPLPMPAMPGGTAWEDLAALLAVERKIRSHPAVDARSVRALRAEIAGDLRPFWRDLAYVLLLHALRAGPLPDPSRIPLEEELTGLLPDAFRAALDIFDARSRERG
jgi:thymidylate synthase